MGGPGEVWVEERRRVRRGGLEEGVDLGRGEGRGVPELERRVRCIFHVSDSEGGDLWGDVVVLGRRERKEDHGWRGGSELLELEEESRVEPRGFWRRLGETARGRRTG